MPRRTEPDPYASKIGARLRELRLERNMSLAELADAAELSKGHLSSVEHGLAAITIQTISRLAKGLGLPPLYLLASPTDDERDHVAELVRKLPSNEVVKLRRELTKAAKEAAKAAKSQPARASR
ncbi:MAG: helix-turn-helix transcriptional regulator [Polyangiaceae bacterium]|nr:helix-turn-helix transcriptional regulator [Polyangiaceae bacterium]